MIVKLRIVIVSCCCVGGLAAVNAAETLKVDTSAVTAKILSGASLILPRDQPAR
jgi:hypothetical protein